MSLSEEAWNDLMEAAKHSQALADDPHFNKMLNTTVAAGEKNSTDTDDSEYYDYDDDYNYFDEETVTISPSPKKAKSNPKLQPIVDATITKSKVYFPHHP